MDINDYGQRLADSRERFQKTTNEIRKNYKRDLNEQEKTHKYREKNQAEVFKNAKLDMEEQNRLSNKRYEKILKKELGIKTDRFKRDMARHLDEFNQARKKSQGEYNRKLLEASDTFKTSMKEKDKLHKINKDGLVDRYENRILNSEKDFHEKVAKVQEKNKNDFRDFRALADAEKKSTMYDHLKEKQGLVQEANIAKNNLNNVHQLEKERLRKSHALDTERAQNNYNTSYKNLLGNKNAEIKTMKENFRELADNITKKEKIELNRLARENKAEKRSLEDRFAADRLDWERKTNKILQEGRTEVADKKTEELKKRYEGRIKKYQDKIVDQELVERERQTRIAKGYQNELKKHHIGSEKKIKEREDEIRYIRQKEIGDIKSSHDDQVENFRYKEKLSNREREKDAISARNNLKDKLDQVRMESSLMQIKQSDVNQEILSQFRDEMKEEQTQYFEDIQRRSHHEREDLKDQLKGTFARKEEGLEKRIESKDKEIKRIKEIYENKISNLTKKSAAEIKAAKKLQHNQRTEDLRQFNRSIKEKKDEYEKQLAIIKKDFDRKLSNSKSASDLHLAKLTRRYEEQLVRERTSSKAELDRRVSTMRDEYERLVRASQVEKESLIAQNEERMNNLRQVNLKAREIEQGRKLYAKS